MLCFHNKNIVSSSENIDFMEFPTEWFFYYRPVPEEENSNVKVGPSLVSPRKGKSSVKVTPFRRKPDELWSGNGFLYL